MKKIVFIAMLLPTMLMAQVSVTPYIGINSTRMTQNVGFANGGSYGVAGVDLELSPKPSPYKALHLTLVTGGGYLPNGFSTTSNTQFTYYRDFYDSKSTQIKTTYWQVPILVRLYIRPFPLMEDWKLFIGAGVVFNNLIKAHMAEQWVYVLKPPVATGFAQGLFPPPQVTQAQDSRDVTSYANKSSTFERFEVGMKFKHFQVTYRYSLSMQDMYFKGIEKVWLVPADDSLYISAHKTRGTTMEKYSEIVFGWRFFN